MALPSIAWQTARPAAEEGLSKSSDLAATLKSLSELKTQRTAEEASLTRATASLEESQRILVQAKAAAPIRAQLRKLPARRKLDQHADRYRLLALRKRSVYQGVSRRLDAAQVLLNETLSVGRLKRMWRRLPTPEEQGNVVENLRLKAEEASTECNETDAALALAERTLAKIMELTGRLAPYAEVPEVGAQEGLVDEFRSEVVTHTRLPLISLRFEGNTVCTQRLVRFQTHSFMRTYFGMPPARRAITPPWVTGTARNGDMIIRSFWWIPSPLVHGLQV